MQIKDHIEIFRAAPGDQPVQQLETFRVVALKEAVMQRNSNGVEPGPRQERGVLARDVGLTVLLPECGRPCGSEEVKYQRADLTRGLRITFEHPYVGLGYQPISQICCANDER